MKISVFGATGGTGNQVVTQALEAGHEVTIFVRNTSHLTIQNEKLTVVTGDVFDAQALGPANGLEDSFEGAVDTTYHVMGFADAVHRAST